MKNIFLLSLLLMSVSVHAESMQVMKSGSVQTSPGPAENFDGKVVVQRFTGVNAPARATTGLVVFDRGAHSAWHTHPLGQTLIVTEGTGRVQEFGQPVHDIRKGDVIWTPPGVKHWHGAAPDATMSHYAITESLDGKAVEWMEKVSKKDYERIPEKN